MSAKLYIIIAFLCYVNVFQTSTSAVSELPCRKSYVRICYSWVWTQNVNQAHNTQNYNTRQISKGIVGAFSFA